MTSTGSRGTKRRMIAAGAGGFAIAATFLGLGLSAAQASAAPQGGLTLKITSAQVTDVDQDGRIGPNDSIAYTMVVDNETGTTLTDLRIDAPAIGNVSCPDGPIPSGMPFRCQTDVPYSLTDDDVDAGHFTATATATATSPDGAQLTSRPASTTTKIPAYPSIALSFDAVNTTDVNGDGRTDAGDTIDYSLVLTNTGNVTVRGVEVNDLRSSGVTCVGVPGPVDVPAGMPFHCLSNSPYVITAQDEAAGVVVDKATARGKAATGSPVQASAEVTTALD